jgi:hypothetical protein
MTIDLLFKLVMLLVPLPAVLVLYRYIGDESQNEAAAEGVFGGIVKCRLAGVLVAYLAIEVAIIFSFFPSFIDVKISNEVQKYEFSVEYRIEDEQKRVLEHRGTLISKSHGGGTRVFDGRFDEAKNLNYNERSWSSEGFLQADMFFIPFYLPNVRQQVMASGSWDRTTATAKLKVFSLFSNDGDSKPIQGQMTLKRVHPWLLLLMLSFIPLFIVYCLSGIGPLVHNVLHLDFKIPILDGNAQVKLGGGVAAYSICFCLAYIVFLEGIPSFSNSELNRQNELLKNYSGEWYFDLYHPKYSVDAEYAGRLKIEGESAENLRTKGRMTTLWLSDKEPYNCYKSAKLKQNSQLKGSQLEYHWESLASVILGESLVTIYKFTGVPNENIRILYSTVFDAEDSDATWTFYDFQDWRPESWFVNAGYIKAFRPISSELAQEKCSQLAGAYN